MGIHFGRLVSGASAALAVSIVVFSLARPSAGVQAPLTRPSVAPAQAAELERASAMGTSLTITARTLEPYLVRQPNGTLTLNAPASVVNRLPANDVQALGVGLTALNAKIATGTLQTSSAGAVFDPTTDRLTLQGGWSGHGYDWWHDYFCLSHDDVQRMTNFGWWAMSGAGIAAIGWFSAAWGAGIFIVISLFGGWMYSADYGNGSCLNAGHWPPPNLWVTSQ